MSAEEFTPRRSSIGTISLVFGWENSSLSNTINLSSATFDDSMHLNACRLIFLGIACW
jgi:hypothetical protein